MTTRQFSLNEVTVTEIKDKGVTVYCSITNKQKMK